MKLMRVSLEFTPREWILIGLIAWWAGLSAYLYHSFAREHDINLHLRWIVMSHQGKEDKP